MTALETEPLLAGVQARSWPPVRDGEGRGALRVQPDAATPGGALAATRRPGVVLDPFAGSGTTAEACIIEGFRSVLIEKDPAYAELIRTRLRKPIQPDMFGGVA